MPIQQLGRYEILEEISRGASGGVYKAHDPLTERIVVIKTIDIELLGEVSDAFERHFYQGDKLADSFNHINIASIYEVGKSGDLAYVVTEFLQGRSLQEIIDSGVVLPLSKIVDVIVQVADGLVFAHRQGIVHRAIKPANIMVLNSGMVKITGFDISLLSTDSRPLSDAAFDSPKYLSPEQAAGCKVDERSDIFSLGVVLYEMLTRTSPFSGSDLNAILYQVISEMPVVPGGFNHSTPPAFDYVIAKAIAKHPDDRYRNAEEFALSLRDYLHYLSSSRTTSKSAFCIQEKQTNQQTTTGIASPLDTSSAGSSLRIVKEARNEYFQQRRKLLYGLPAALFALAVGPDLFRKDTVKQASPNEEKVSDVSAFFMQEAKAATLGEPSQPHALHALNRLAFGPRAGDLEYVARIGVERYIDEQLNPQRIPLPPSLTQRLTTLTSQEIPPGELLREFFEAQQAIKKDPDNKGPRRELLQRLAEQTAEARLVRGIYSPRQLEEVMVDFWFNHFNVFSGKGLDRVLVGNYEREAIRPYVLGRFRDLLGATAKHPAMLFYLDNWLSVAADYHPPAFAAKNQLGKATGLNENYARELMELHTLGVDGGYTQKDVTELARILTGWTFTPREMARGRGGFRFDEKRHDWGSKEWLGHHVPPRGQDEGEWVLDVLTRHPATAHHISYKLAQYFISDTPPQALVEKLARRFLDSQGDIRAVLQILFASREFWEPKNIGTKFKTPYQYVISSLRVANIPVVNIRPLLGALAQLGMPLYGCQTPDGYKNTESTWMNPDALTRRINFATALATGRLPLAKPFDPDEGKGMSKQQLERAAQPGDVKQWNTPPVDTEALLNTLGPALSEQTRTIIKEAQPALRSALALGSPDFMRH